MIRQAQCKFRQHQHLGLAAISPWIMEKIIFTVVTLWALLSGIDLGCRLFYLLPAGFTPPVQHMLWNPIKLLVYGGEHI